MTDKFLGQIVEAKLNEIAQIKKNRPITSLRPYVSDTSRPSLVEAISTSGFSLIAEAKRRSPSKGVLRDPFEPVNLVTRYQRAGACASTVLADAKFFGGGPDVVATVAQHPGVRIPIIYKDFFVDPYQVALADEAGASAILIIVRILSQETLDSILIMAERAGLDVIFECFTEADIEIATNANAQIIGINSRDLKTFDVDIENAARLRQLLPVGVLSILESGVKSAEDIGWLAQEGFDAVLIGETILTTPRVEDAIEALMSKVWEGGTMGVQA